MATKHCPRVGRLGVLDLEIVSQIARSTGWTTVSDTTLFAHILALCEYPFNYAISEARELF